MDNYFRQTFGNSENFLYFCTPKRRGARVVEEARLESVYTPKGYHEFESRSLRNKCWKPADCITKHPVLHSWKCKTGCFCVRNTSIRSR